MAYNPINFVQAVESLSGLTVNVDFEVTDRGEGPFISLWKRPDVTEPTLAQIQSVDTDALIVKVKAVTAVQGRIALLNANLLTPAQNAVNAAGGAASIWWAYAAIWERDNTLLNSLGAALNLTPAQIDQLFLAAAQIK